MISKHIDNLLAIADDKLAIAENELSRPSGDAMTMTICHTSNHAIRQYLVSVIAYNYSLEHPTEEIVYDTLSQIENWDIDFLIQYASRLDSRFGDMEINHLNCSGMQKDQTSEIYCLEIDIVKQCADTARDISELVQDYIRNVKEPKDIAALDEMIRNPQL